MNSLWILTASHGDTGYGRLVGPGRHPRMCHQEEPHVKARNTRPIIVVAVLALIAAACGGGGAEGKLGELQEAGTVTVGLANEVPYGY